MATEAIFPASKMSGKERLDRALQKDAQALESVPTPYNSTTSRYFKIMLFLTSLILTFTSLTSVFASPLQNAPRATGSLSSWLASESPVALQGVLDNIGSAGSGAPGAKAGIVVASPSKTNPDCEF